MQNTYPPSLDLSFDWVKPVLENQERNAEIYNNRLLVLFSVATTILGIGFPLAFGDLSKVLHIPYSLAAWLIVVSFISYILSACVLAAGIWPRKFIRLDDPTKIREEFWDLQPSKFKEQILVHTEDAYTSNNHQLRCKARSIYGLAFLLPIETVSLVLAFALSPR